MNAINKENKGITQVLLDAGADVDLAAGDGIAALINAIEKEDKKLAIKLLERAQI